MRWLSGLIAMLFFFPPIGNALETGLDPSRRSEIRQKLEKLFNEMDLLVLNRRSDTSDIRKQERDFAGLGVFERVPFSTDLAGIRKSLADSSAMHEVRVISVALEGRSPPGSQVPRSVFTDRPRFHFAEDQLIERLHLRITAEGNAGEIRDWVRKWRTESLRLIESRAIRKAGNAWVIQADAFRFRKVKFPELKPRDPLELLPDWARKNPDKFVRQEPLLWSFVTRIQSLRSAALPLYKNKEDFLLNSARMDFFISKVVAPDPHPGTLGGYASRGSKHLGGGRRSVHAHKH